MKRDFITMARVGRRRRVAVPPRVAREPSVVVGVRDIVTILPGAEQCTVPFWIGQLVEACPELRGRGMGSGRGE
jgi:hypothetical protein